MERISHRNAARLIAWTMVVVAVVGGALGLWMRLHIGGELPRGSDPLAAAQAYDTAFSLHGFLLVYGLLWPGVLGVVGNLYVSGRSGPRSRGGVIACAGAAVWLLGLLLCLVSTDMLVDPVVVLESTGWKVRVMLLLVGDLLVMLGILVGQRAGAHQGKPAREAQVLHHAILWSCAVRLVSDLLLIIGLWRVGTVAAVGHGFPSADALLLGLAVVAVGGHRGSIHRGLALAAIVVLTLGELLAGLLAALLVVPGIVDFDIGGSVFILGRALVLVSLVGLRRLRTTEPSPARGHVALARWCYLLWWMVSGFLVTLNVDVHLHDTYFVVGSFHLEVLTTVGLGALIALRYYWKSAYERASAWEQALPVLLVAAGILWMCGAMLVLGQQGMPRRYFTYVPQFHAMHQQVTLGAFVLVAGLLSEAVVWLRARRRLVGEPARPQ